MAIIPKSFWLKVAIIPKFETYEAVSLKNRGF